MNKGRLEAFSDAVIAIAITIMVLELVPPHGATLDDLATIGPTFLSYVLSFVYLGLYWNNHHHLLQATKVIDGRVLLANLHLLFWLTLVPFGNAWMGENNLAAVPVAAYGVVMLLAAFANFLLVMAILRCQPPDSTLATAIGGDAKGKLSVLAFLVAIPIALVVPLAALAIYIGMAAVWFIPDRRIERAVGR
jgi:uncharacterized membrane protein